MAFEKKNIIDLQKRLAEEIVATKKDEIAISNFRTKIFVSFVFSGTNLRKPVDESLNIDPFARFGSEQRHTTLLYEHRLKTEEESHVMSRLRHYMSFERDEENASSLKLILRTGRPCYKIHVQLSLDQLYDNLKKIHDNLPYLSLFIRAFKYCWQKSRDYDEKYEIPTLVFYCRPYQRCAQLTLDRVVQLFGHLEMKQRPPMYNIHVVGPVFYAGGNRDHKWEVLKEYGQVYQDLIWDSKVGHALYVGQPALDLFKLKTRF